MTRELPPDLMVAPLADPYVEAHGYEPTSLYVEMYWTPVLGPTATLLYRRLGSWVLDDEGLIVPTLELASDLGLKRSLSPNGQLAKAIGRLVRFRAARWDEDTLLVRKKLPGAEGYRRRTA